MIFFGRGKKANDADKNQKDELELAIATSARLADIVVRHTQGTTPGIDPFAAAPSSPFSFLQRTDAVPAPVASAEPAVVGPVVTSPVVASPVVASPATPAAVIAVPPPAPAGPAPASPTPAERARSEPAPPAPAPNPFQSATPAPAAAAARPVDPALEPAYRGVLQELAARCAGLVCASISAKDGTEIASIGGLANERMSVASGTMQALSDGIVAEAALGESRDIILDVGENWLFIISVRQGPADLVLSGMVGRGMALGILLSGCAAACDAIGRLASERS